MTHIGNKSGAVRKTPLMRVKDSNSYVLVGSQGGAPTDPVWVHNLRVNPDVEIRDETVVRPMRVREVEDENERSRLWKLAIAAYPPYAEYQERTARRIPVFVAEPRSRRAWPALVLSPPPRDCPPLMSEFGQTRRGSTFARSRHTAHHRDLTMNTMTATVV